MLTIAYQKHTWNHQALLKSLFWPLLFFWLPVSHYLQFKFRSIKSYILCKYFYVVLYCGLGWKSGNDGSIWRSASMDEAKIGFPDKNIFVDMVSEPWRVSLLQGLALYKIDIIYNNTLIMAMAKLFLYAGNKKIKQFIRSPRLSWTHSTWLNSILFRA